MELNRRELLALSGGTVACFAFGVSAISTPAWASATDERIKAFAGDAELKEGRITLTAPEIAENGNTVPIEVKVESPMTKDDYVSEVMVLADGNPMPGVVTFLFSPMSGEATATTRIRLATTQNVIAVAKMSNGSVFMEKKNVKVTIGGCGG